MPEVAQLKGIGEARAKAFARAGIVDWVDLLEYDPASYKDFRRRATVAQAIAGEEKPIALRICAAPSLYMPHRGLSILRASAKDSTGSLQLVWFNQPYIRQSLTVGADYVVDGQLEYRQGGWQMTNPTLYPLEKAPQEILPVYRPIDGVPQGVLRKAVAQVLEASGTLPETLPEAVLQRFSLCSRDAMLRALHFPDDAQGLERARHRKAMESMISFQLSVLISAKGRSRPLAEPMRPDPRRIQQLLDALPYRLTDAQQKAWREIYGDLCAPVTMSRLLQGDVGSGKTVVAFLAALAAQSAGYQSAIMAPTEVLAMQHVRLADKLLTPLGVRIAHVLGSQGVSERKQQLERIASGQAHLVIGTHALIQRAVQFNSLGLIVVDEQHRFGVMQRSRLGEKAQACHTLVLSATPIPRTLALILYADMDVSVIDALPPGRQPVRTRVVPLAKREGLWQYVRQRAEQGEQAYVVCPLVGESDKIDAMSVESLYRELIGGPLRDVRCAMLHGRMSAQQKQKILQAFAQGETKVLISTSVIEVGIDVPNATVMAIENAERFGLSQLHQLRGRVGRGKKQSFCFLISGATGEARERLDAMTKTNSGFEVAQKDLELRGPGQFLGTMQHGAFPWPKEVDLYDMALVRDARDVAKALLESEGTDARSAAWVRRERESLRRLGENIFH